jgi:hypothetical protein
VTKAGVGDHLRKDQWRRDIYVQLKPKEGMRQERSFLGGFIEIP